MSLASAFGVAGARWPDRVAIFDERGAVSFSDLDRRTDAQARGLAQLGVRADDVVGVCCRNHRGIVEATGALAKLGAHACYLNTAFSRRQLAEVIGREHVTAAVVDEEFAGLLDGVDVEPRVLAWHEAGPDLHTLDALAEIRDPFGRRPPRPPTPARTIIMTSGTTGVPKGASREQQASTAPAVAILERIPYRARETMVIAAPLFHSWGFGNFMIAMLLGNTMVLDRRFDPGRVLTRLAQYRAEVLVAVPVMLARLLDARPSEPRGLEPPALRLVPLSGSRLPGDLATRFMDRFGDVLYNLYGSTEVGYVSIATPEDLRAAPTTAGRVTLGTTVRLLDRDGNEVPPGATGRIFVRSELLFDGYTGGGSKEIVDGHMSTGDTGHFDEAGRLFVDGRDDEMIVSGGENVFPTEVEDVLATHPAVADVAVVGVPDPEWGERLRAYVVVRADAALDADGVRTFVHDHLAGYKVPRDVLFVDELPRNPTGKVLRRELPPPPYGVPEV